MKATRQAVAPTLIEMGKENPNIVALDADLAESTGLNKFGKEFPDRFFDCGVAEQNMMSTAAGLAVSGKTPFVGSFTVFTIGRAWDQLRNVVAYADLNVKICSTHSGVSVGEDGSSHQPIEDIAMLRALPNMKIIVPADFYEAREALKASVEIPGPVFIRLGRPKMPQVYDDDYSFKFGKADVLKAGKDLSIIATGLMVRMALDAADMLQQDGIDAEVINMSTIKPLDEATLIESARKTGRVLTVEEHSIVGGLGGAVSETLSEKLPTPVTRIGVKDRFGTSGPYQEVLKYFGLTPENIVKTAKEALL
jgi:transketolase